MPTIARRPLFALCLCGFMLVCLIVVLAILVSDDTTTESNVSGMTEPTQCTVLPGTDGVDVSDDGKRCRAYIDVMYVRGTQTITAIAWSGLVETFWGSCDVARSFSLRFPTAGTVDCWYDPSSSRPRVRLWSAEEAGTSAVNVSDDDSSTTTATTVVVVLMAVLLLFAMLYLALRCGIFGPAGTKWASYPFRGWKWGSRMPVEPTAHSPRALDQPMGGYREFSSPTHLPSPPPGALPPHANTKMVNIGTAQVPAEVANKYYERNNVYMGASPPYQPVTPNMDQGYQPVIRSYYTPPQPYPPPRMDF